MVDKQLSGRDITDTRVLKVFRKVPRHEFIPLELINSAYEDCPLPIGSGQTISQPYMVALMTQLLQLKGDERVLEVGTGSGYQTAVLAELAGEVFSIERIERLAEQARRNLSECGYRNVKIFSGDGTQGLETFRPFDRIIVTAAAPEVPESLKNQLKDKGRMVIPVGQKYLQKLQLIKKLDDVIIEKNICDCVFVPLVGREGWKQDYD